ncbi:MAG: KH domain-containing protein [Candidatus Dormibacteraeota bacterium]|uniref:RNA-binding protein KhpA n=1 Tax=Candidatus Dormiibacter inghamiae TaxID=3127013 RepID=A0A934K851_9BACT|nr:KH domain-containing protein [Candidatus Dormibacteraeota bacterium]MBJ7607527.1 KH domain-containing protein [Candidatus Dormibacteraeota bacterium]
MQNESPPPFRRGGSFGGGREFGGRGEGAYRRNDAPGGSETDYKALVEFIAQSVADSPGEVEVRAVERGRGTTALKVKMADADLGRLIGKSGRNIEALRTLIRVASLRERKRVFVDLVTGR